MFSIYLEDEQIAAIDRAFVQHPAYGSSRQKALRYAIDQFFGLSHEHAKSGNSVFFDGQWLSQEQYIDRRVATQRKEVRREMYTEYLARIGKGEQLPADETEHLAELKKEFESA